MVERKPRPKIKSIHEIIAEEPDSIVAKIWNAKYPHPKSVMEDKLLIQIGAIFDHKCYVCGKKALTRFKACTTSVGEPVALYPSPQDKDRSDFRFQIHLYLQHLRDTIRREPGRFIYICQDHRFAVDYITNFNYENLWRLIDVAQRIHDKTPRPINP